MGAAGTALRSAVRSAKVDHTVDALDLAAFMGVWYQSAATPNFFQTFGARDVIAVYTLTDAATARFAITNCEVVSQDRANCINGYAHADPLFVAQHDNGKFLVEFPSEFPQQEQQYWVFMVGPKQKQDASSPPLYEWTIVGDGTLSYIWLLTRRPLESHSTAAMAILNEFDLAHPDHAKHLRWTQHTDYWQRHAIPGVTVVVVNHKPIGTSRNSDELEV